MAEQHLVELALEPAALRRAVAQEDARIRGKAVLVLEAQVEDGDILVELLALRGDLDGAGPLLAGDEERAGQDIEQLALVGRDLGFRRVLEPLPQLAVVDLGRSLGLIPGKAQAESGRKPRDETAALLLGVLGLLGRDAGLGAQARIGVLEEAARRKAGELLIELRAEIGGRVGVARACRRGHVLEAFGNDETRFLRRAAFQERDRAGLLDAVDVGLGEHTAHLAVEVLQARDDEDGVGHAVGDLDEVAHGALEALLGVVEEAQVLDLVDAEDERGAVDRPHQRAERGDDLEGAVLARVGVECRDRLMCQRGERAAVEVLAHALVDARIAALQIQQRAHDVDVEALRGVLRARDDLIGELQDERRELAVIEARLAQRFQILLGDDSGVVHEARGKAGERALTRAVGVVGLLQRVHEPAQVVVGVVGDVGRHLRVAEIGRAAAMRGGSQCAQRDASCRRPTGRETAGCGPACRCRGPS